MIIIHDSRLPVKYTDGLSGLFPGSLLIPLDMSGKSGVYESIISHPDIYFFQPDERTLVHSPNMRKDVLDNLCELGIKLIPGEVSPSGNYPGTVLYNAVRIGRFVVGNFEYLDNAVKEVIREMGLSPVDVAQGYSRCSVLPLNDNCAITSDKGISRELEKNGVDTLHISHGHIVLPGEERGFIGGSGGRTPDGSVAVLGDVVFHPDTQRIREFTLRKNINFLDLAGCPLYDAGSIIFLKFKERK
ncbi:MAG: hypothetical protein HQL30_00840 [Candidatus Omnitrophica bacterium]|nr:hypothetical protein [Candidatus Omnitrophota bacterium]